MPELHSSKFLVAEGRSFDSMSTTLGSHSNFLLFLSALLLLIFAFSPPVTLFFSVLLLLFPINGDKNLYRAYLFVLQGAIFSSLIVGSLSEPVLLFKESDFTSYYNNYLGFLDRGFSADSFEWGGGIEVGLPFFNYLLSLIIREGTPIIVKLFYTSAQLFLFFYLLSLLRVRMKLTLQEYALLIACSIAFFKYGALQNHLRQGFSSLFILISMASEGRQKKVLFLICAFTFHISTVIIYPLLVFLLNDSNTRKKKYFIVLSCLLALCVFLLMPAVSAVVDLALGPILSKLVWALLRFSDSDFVISSIRATLVRVAYLFPLLCILMFVRSSEAKNIRLSLWSIVVFSVAFSYLPGFTVRMFSSLFLIYIGVFYFQVLRIRVSLFSLKTLIVILWIGINLNWLFEGVLYYYEFPVASLEPFYFTSDIMRESPEVDRQNLPWFKDLF